ncbi:unnamed protein product [Mytilus coruscus]|uniref:C1q domain-containing protein n=1 Tax=Mytilus coruscus TaxID=42192 RepID=A0A6J8CYC4_MYTCO|nr:unnamed protein product [Mytilus coruscus]
MKVSMRPLFVILIIIDLCSGAHERCYQSHDILANGCSVPILKKFLYKKTFTPACLRHDICYHCVIWCMVTFMYCEGIHTTEMTFLKTKIIQMEKSMSIQDDRIRYLEKNEVLQDQEIKNLKEEIYRLRPDMKSVKRSMNSMMKILMKNRRRLVRDYPPNLRSDSRRHKSIIQRDVGIEESKTNLMRQASQIIAFYAYLNNDVKSPGIHQTLVFDNVITNEGKWYNKFSGTFSAPINGLYVFSCSIIMDGPGQYASFEIVKNADIIGTFFVDPQYDEGYKYSSLTLVTDLHQTDTVFVRIGSSYAVVGNVLSKPYARSSFTGWKLN